MSVNIFSTKDWVQFQQDLAEVRESYVSLHAERNNLASRVRELENQNTSLQTKQRELESKICNRHSIHANGAHYCNR